MVKTTVKFNSNIPAVKDAYGIKANNALNAAANDLMSGSLRTTPMKTGKLRANRKKNVLGIGKIQVIWSSAYAAVQEAGIRRGARAFRHYTTPGTGAHFVSRKVEDIKSNFTRYWK